MLARPDPTNNEIETLNLGSMPELSLGCAVNAASLWLAPLAPQKIVSLFGKNLGPAEPVYGLPGTWMSYPLEFGGSKVTFDGIPAPLIYVSASQINAVTPAALLRKQPLMFAFW